MYVLLTLLAITNLFAYLSMSYFLYLFVKAKRQENFEGLSRWRKAGIFISLPIVTIAMALYHKAILTREKKSDRTEE